MFRFDSQFSSLSHCSKGMSLAIIDANPLASCIMGGRECVMVLQETVVKDQVTPVFQVFSHGSRRSDLDRYITQPVKDAWGPSTILSFTCPPQPRLDYLESIGEKVVLMLTIVDQYQNVSPNLFQFNYSSHKAGPGQYHGQRCLHCSGLLE